MMFFTGLMTGSVLTLLFKRKKNVHGFGSTEYARSMENLIKTGEI